MGATSHGQLREETGRNSLYRGREETGMQAKARELHEEEYAF